MWNSFHYHQQMINLNNILIKKWPEWATRREKLILQHNIFFFTCSKSGQRHHFYSWLGILVRSKLHARLSPFRLALVFIDHALSMKHLKHHGDVEKWLDDNTWKDARFFWEWIYNLPKRWGKCVASDDTYFE